MSDDKTLLRMANQIAANLHVGSEDENVTAIAAHIRQFWTKKMRAEIGALAEHEPEKLDPLARKALAALAKKA